LKRFETDLPGPCEWLAREEKGCMFNNFGAMAILHIVANLVFIGLAWWALQALNYEKFLRKNRTIQARLLFIFLAIIIGSLTAQFFLDYLSWSQQIPYIYE
jgi:uncharacterized integral membrane protein (TIGR02327 family)